jgi:hypothetical protein
MEPLPPLPRLALPAMPSLPPRLLPPASPTSDAGSKAVSFRDSGSSTESPSEIPTSDAGSKALEFRDNTETPCMSTDGVAPDIVPNIDTPWARRKRLRLMSGAAAQEMPETSSDVAPVVTDIQEERPGLLPDEDVAVAELSEVGIGIPSYRSGFHRQQYNV